VRGSASVLDGLEGVYVTHLTSLLPGELAHGKVEPANGQLVEAFGAFIERDRVVLRSKKQGGERACALAQESRYLALSIPGIQ